MGWEKQFRDTLQGFYERRRMSLERDLREILSIRGLRGAPVKARSDEISDTIDALVSIAMQSHEMKRRLEKEFYSHSKRYSGTRFVNRRHVSKKIKLHKWASELPARFVYVFWKGDVCLYVGRTGGGGSRPTNYQNIYWFKDDVTRVEAYTPTNSKYLAALECLAIHVFNPRKNEVMAGRDQRPFAKQCPICRDIGQFADRVESAFDFS